MIRPPFPEVIDSSLLSAFTSCPRKCELEYIQHWKTKGKNVHLHAGGAYAHGLEAARRAYYGEGIDSLTAEGRGLKALLEFYGDYQCPPEEWKSAERMAGAMEFYFSQYPMDRDHVRPARLPADRLGVEFNFTHPIDCLHPATGNPLLFTGRFDMIVDFAGGLYGFDDKTSKQLGPQWSKQWDLRGQFSAYCWGAKESGLPLAGFLIRGVSILKKGYDTQEAITVRSGWMIDRWYEQLLLKVSRMKEMWLMGVWDYALDDACNSYGGCQFRNVCLSSNPTPWLETAFERREWNPVTRMERIL